MVLVIKREADITTEAFSDVFMMSEDMRNMRAALAALLKYKTCVESQIGVCSADAGRQLTH